MLFALRLLRESLDLYTAVLLWQNDDGTHLRISELASDAPNLSEGPFLAGDGIFGAAIAAALGGVHRRPQAELQAALLRRPLPGARRAARSRSSSTGSSAALYCRAIAIRKRSSESM